MNSQGVQSVRATPDWLWTWNGVCFGYRQGDSLFTYDGIEVGRFSGTEVYGVDGRYLGELSNVGDTSRLTTNLYKKSRTVPEFVPTFGRAYTRPENRPGESLFCGYENFPSPEILRRMIVRAAPEGQSERQ
jgi:hypothetical protein